MKMYDNRSLFSDYYLSELVRDDPHWKSTLQSVADLRHRIAEVYERGTPGIEQAAEGEVEERLIRPVLRALGHEFEVGPNVRSAEGTKTPDYGFFATVEDRAAADKAGIDGYWKHALAVGDAKAWDRSLDRRLKGPGDPFTNHNPSYQIDFYLRATDLKWGILTNGRLWRLYYRDLSYRLDVYYEVNLPELLQQSDEAFNYFAAFFAQRGFLADEQGERFLDRAYKGSIAYATGLSKELKDNVYEALRLLTEGFLRFPANGLTPTDLDTVRENAFVVIYRLLFVLYAEDRGFLPLENRDYGDTYSLRALAKEIAQKMDGQTGFSPAASGYWSRLQDVFRMIDGGDTALGIPPYNGGLFDESRHPELGHWGIGDAYLARAVDKLTRAEAAQRTGRGFVSYRELSIRELGSIYEGLLEHRPRVAEGEVCVVRDGKAERIVPADEVGSRRVIGSYSTGSVFLETDKGERKATGSYYTPDYIVKYIVANTVGPLLEEKKVEGGDLIEGIQSLKVLDPAMGSGHFLVEATDFLARALVEALGGDPRELGDDDIRWARREVVERCIYGVDLNPLAVELAKLSLWLHTVSRDRPLNFLDHHLRCGNSLIGAWLRDLGQLPQAGSKGTKKKAKQATAVTTLEGHGLTEAIAAAVKTFHVIAAAPTHSVEDVHMKENAYQTARHALSRIVDIADAWTSAYFGNEVDPDGYTQLLIDAYQGDGDWPKPGDAPWLDAARGIGREEHRFFHWELEFPEVFFDSEGAPLESAGFRAVVGNPPYVSAWEMTEQAPEERRVIRALLEREQPLGAHWDLYLAFLLRGLSLTALEGLTGLILPNPFAREKYASNARGYILRTCAVESVLSFAEVNVFDEVARQTMIPILRRVADHRVLEGHLVNVVSASGTVEAPDMVLELPQRIWLETPGNQWRLELGGNVPGILQTIESQTVKVGNLCYVNYGAQVSSKTKGGFGKEHLVSHQPKGQKPKRFFEGRDLRRHEIVWSGLYLDYRQDEMYGPRAPELFESPKIVIRKVSGEGDSVLVALDLEGLYCDDGLILVTPYANTEGTVLRREFAEYPILEAGEYRLEYLAAILASRALSFYYRHRFATGSLQRSFSHVYPQAVRAMPVREIRFTTPRGKRQQRIAEAQSLYEEASAVGELHALQEYVYSCLRRQPDGTVNTNLEQSDVIHDVLVFLVEEMMRLQKAKQDETKAFIGWLQGYIGVGLQGLKNRTKVGEYYLLEGGWEEFAVVLDQNQHTIQQAKGMDITRREPREAIRQEYGASMTRLRPLLRKIEFTDRLIDLIVYRL